MARDWRGRSNDECPIWEWPPHTIPNSYQASGLEGLLTRTANCPSRTRIAVIGHDRGEEQKMWASQWCHGYTESLMSRHECGNFCCNSENSNEIITFQSVHLGNEYLRQSWASVAAENHRSISPQWHHRTQTSRSKTYLQPQTDSGWNKWLISAKVSYPDYNQPIILRTSFRHVIA